MINYSAQKPPASIEKHYTPNPLARFLVSLVPIKKHQRVLDPAAGKNRVFYQAFPGQKLKCEIRDGQDFLSTRISYDWAITNPPYHLLWQFVEKTSREARVGFAYLININGLNSLTPRRLALLRLRGFHLRHIHVCCVKQWFGRYYFVVFMKERGACEFSWTEEQWS